MKRFYRWLYNKIMHANAEAVDAEEEALWAVSSTRSTHNFDVPNSVRFTIYKANGGYVVEYISTTRSSTNSYDDESKTSLHIIAEDADVGQEIAKIVTFELLRG